MPDPQSTSPAGPIARPRPDRAITLVAGGCLAVLVFVLFGEVLFKDRQFAYRDASQFYYPLYQRVQEQWAAGAGRSGCRRSMGECPCWAIRSPRCFIPAR